MQTDLIMSNAAAALTHTATTGGLTIKSTSGYVDVESVRFTDAKIGIAADIDLVNLANGAVTISGTLDAVALSGLRQTSSAWTLAQATRRWQVHSGVGATTLSDTLNVAKDMTLQKNIIMSRLTQPPPLHTLVQVVA